MARTRTLRSCQQGMSMTKTLVRSFCVQTYPVIRTYEYLSTFACLCTKVRSYQGYLRTGCPVRSTYVQ